MNAEAVPIMTERPDKPAPEPVHPSPETIDLDRVVFDPEYRARVRDALNRAGRTPSSRPAPASKPKSRCAA